MEITKELKEKLLQAGSLEEVKALLGEQTTEEETARLWHEIQTRREPGDLEKVDDDELEAVSGGAWCAFLGECEYAKDGREVGCVLCDYSDWDEANSKICPKGSAVDGWYHKWVKAREFRKDRRLYGQDECSKCHKRGTPYVMPYGDPTLG